MRLIIFVFLFSNVAFADCPEWYVTWPHNDKVYPKDSAPVGSYRLPSRQDGKCVEIVDLDFVDGRLEENSAARDARIAAEAAKESARLNRIAAMRNIDTAIDNASTLAQMKVVVKQILKALVIEMGRD